LNLCIIARGLYLFSQDWFETVHDVLQALWHEVRHSPQPVFAAVASFFAIVTICFILVPPSGFLSNYNMNGPARKLYAVTAPRYNLVKIIAPTLNFCADD